MKFLLFLLMIVNVLKSDSNSRINDTANKKKVIATLSFFDDKKNFKVSDMIYFQVKVTCDSSFKGKLKFPKDPYVNSSIDVAMDINYWLEKYDGTKYKSFLIQRAVDPLYDPKREYVYIKYGNSESFPVLADGGFKKNPGKYRIKIRCNFKVYNEKAEDVYSNWFYFDITK